AAPRAGCHRAPRARGPRPAARGAPPPFRRAHHRAVEIWLRCSSAVNLGDVVLGLFQADPFQASGWELSVQAAPDGHRDVFGGGQTTLKPRYVPVQMAMVDVMDDELLHN